MSDLAGDTTFIPSAQPEMDELSMLLQRIRISHNPSEVITDIVQVFLDNETVGSEFDELIDSIEQEYPTFNLDDGNWKIIFVNKLVEFLIEKANLASIESSHVIENLILPDKFKKDCEDAKQQISRTEQEIKGFITDAANAKTVALLTTARNEMQKRKGQGVLYIGPLSDSEKLSEILQNHFFPFSHFIIQYSLSKRGFFVYAKNSQDIQGIPEDARSIELLTNPPLPLLSEYTNAIKNFTDKETGSEGIAQAALKKLKNFKKRAEVAKPFVAIGVNYAVNFIPVVGRAYSTLSTMEQKISKYGKPSTFRTSSGFEWQQDIRVIEIDGVTSVIAYDLSDDALKARGEVYLARQWAIEEAGLTVDPKIFLGIEQILYSLGDQKDNIGKLKDLNRIFARGLIRFLSDESYYNQVLGTNPEPPYANLFRKSDDGKSIILNAYQIEKLIRRIKNLEDKKVLGNVAGQEFLIVLNALKVDELSNEEILKDAERICEGNINLIEKLSGLNKSNVARATIAGVGAAAGITAGVSAATVGVLTSFDAIMSAGEVAINLNERQQKEIIKRISLENLDELSDEELTKRVAEISNEVAVKTSKELIVAMASYFILSRLLLRGSVASLGGNGTMQATGDFMGRGLIILTKAFLAKREFERKNNTQVKTAAEVVAWLRNDTETFYELRNFISGMSMAAGVSRSVESFTHETMASMVVKLIPKGTPDNQANDLDLDALQNTTTAKPLDESGCFLAGTIISTPNGNIKIEELKIEDNVFGFNISTQKIEEQKISEVFVHNVQGYYRLKVKVEDKEIELFVTGEHRFYVGENNFEAVEKLEEGAKLYCKVEIRNSKFGITEVELISKEYFDKTVQVYNFTTLPDHTYFAEGILVHNVKAAVVREESLTPKLNTPENLEVPKKIDAPQVEEKLFDVGPKRPEHMGSPTEEFRVENVYRLFSFGAKADRANVHFATAGFTTVMIDNLEKRLGSVKLEDIKKVNFSSQEAALEDLKKLGFSRQEAYTFWITVKNPTTYEYIYNGYAKNAYNSNYLPNQDIANPTQFANPTVPEQYPNANLHPATTEDLKTATQNSRVELEQATKTDTTTIKVGADYETLRSGIDLKLKGNEQLKNNVIGQVLADILSSPNSTEILRNRVHGSDLEILKKADYNDILKSISLLQEDPNSNGFGTNQTVFKAVKNVFGITRANPNTLVILLHNTITHETHLKRSDLNDVFLKLDQKVLTKTPTGIEIKTPATLLIANDSHAEIEINKSIKAGNAPEGSFLSHKEPYTPEIKPNTPTGDNFPEPAGDKAGVKVDGSTVDIGGYKYLEIAPGKYSLLDSSGKQTSTGTAELIKLEDGNYYIVKNQNSENLDSATSLFMIKNGKISETEIVKLPDKDGYYHKVETGIEGLINYTKVSNSGKHEEYYSYLNSYYFVNKMGNGMQLVSTDVNNKVALFIVDGPTASGDKPTMYIQAGANVYIDIKDFDKRPFATANHVEIISNKAVIRTDRLFILPLESEPFMAVKYTSLKDLDLYTNGKTIYNSKGEAVGAFSLYGPKEYFYLFSESSTVPNDGELNYQITSVYLVDTDRTNSHYFMLSLGIQNLDTLFIDKDGKIADHDKSIEELTDNTFRYNGVTYEVDKDGKLTHIGGSPNTSTPLPTSTPITNTPVPPTRTPSPTSTATTVDVLPTNTPSPTSTATTADVLPTETKPASTNTPFPTTPEPIKPSATPSPTNTVVPTDVPPTSTVAATETLAVMPFLGKNLQYDQKAGGYVWEKVEGTIGDKIKVVFVNDGDQIPDRIIKVDASGNSIFDYKVRVNSSNPNLVYFINSDDKNLHNSFIRTTLSGNDIDIQDQTGTTLIKAEGNKFVEVKLLSEKFYIDSNNVLYGTENSGKEYIPQSSFQAVNVEDGLIIVVNSEGKIIAFTKNFVYGGEQEPLDYIVIDDKTYRVTGKNDKGEYIIKLVEEPTKVPSSTATNTLEPTVSSSLSSIDVIISGGQKHFAILEDGKVKLGEDTVGFKITTEDKTDLIIVTVDNKDFILKDKGGAWGPVEDAQIFTYKGVIYTYIGSSDSTAISFFIPTNNQALGVVADFSVNESFENSIVPNELKIKPASGLDLTYNRTDIFEIANGTYYAFVNGLGNSRSVRILQFIDGKWELLDQDHITIGDNTMVVNENGIFQLGNPISTPTNTPATQPIENTLTATPNPTNTEIPIQGRKINLSSKELPEFISKIDSDSAAGVQLTLSGRNILDNQGNIIGERYLESNLYKFKIGDKVGGLVLNGDSNIIYYNDVNNDTIKVLFPDGTYYYNGSIDKYYNSSTDIMGIGFLESLGNKYVFIPNTSEALHPTLINLNDIEIKENELRLKSTSQVLQAIHSNNYLLPGDNVFSKIEVGNLDVAVTPIVFVDGNDKFIVYKNPNNSYEQLTIIDPDGKHISLTNVSISGSNTFESGIGIFQYGDNSYKIVLVQDKPKLIALEKIDILNMPSNTPSPTNTEVPSQTPSPTATSTIEQSTSTPSPTNTSVPTDLPVVSPTPTIIAGKGQVITLPEGEMPEVLSRMDTNSSSPGVQLILDSDVIRNAAGEVIAKKSITPNTFIFEHMKGGLYIKDDRIDVIYKNSDSDTDYKIIFDNVKYRYNNGNYFRYDDNESVNLTGINPDKFIVVRTTDDNAVLIPINQDKMFSVKNGSLYAENRAVGTGIIDHNYWLNDGRDTSTNGVMVSNGVYDNGNIQVLYFKTDIENTVLAILPDGKIVYYNYFLDKYYDSNKQPLPNKYFVYNDNIISFFPTNEEHPKLLIVSSEIDKQFEEDVYNKSRNILLGLGALGGATALGAYGTNLALKKRARQKNISKYLETQVPEVQDRGNKLKQEAAKVWDDSAWN